MKSRLAQNDNVVTMMGEREEDEIEEIKGCSKESIAKCIQIMKKEGISRDVIIKVMQESFHVLYPFVYC